MDVRLVFCYIDSALRHAARKGRRVRDWLVRGQRRPVLYRVGPYVAVTVRIGRGPATRRAVAARLAW